jgi:hypothetical protein
MAIHTVRFQPNMEPGGQSWRLQCDVYGPARHRYLSSVVFQSKGSIDGHITASGVIGDGPVGIKLFGFWLVVSTRQLLSLDLVKC